MAYARPVALRTSQWLLARAASLLPAIEAVGPERARRDMGRMTRLLARIAPPPKLDRTDETIAGVPVRRYRPADARPGAIVYFHGGGWVVGDLDTHDVLCATLAHRTRRELVAVHYRRAPEHPLPAAIDDCDAVTAAIAGAQPVIVAGDSAGGHLAAVVARRRAQRSEPLAGQLLVYPVTECGEESDSYRRFGTGHFLTAATMRFFRDAFVPELAHRDHPEASPLRAPSLRTASARVVLASHDVLRDEGHAYAKKLEAEGTEVELDEVEGVLHGFVSGPDPIARAAIARSAAWIDRVLD